MSISKIDVNTEPTYWHADAVVAGDYIFTSYQAGVYDDDGHLIDTVDGQTEQAIKNLAGTLAKAGATLEDVVKVDLYFADKSDRPLANVHWLRLWPHQAHRPARQAHQSALPEGCCLQIVAMAVLEGG